MSALGDVGYAIYYTGIPMRGPWLVAFGTSASAPLWGALAALTNASPECAGSSVGFMNPALYTVGGGPHYASAFNDITVGNNDFTGTNGGLYPAGTGYDMATGIGSPIAWNEDGEGLAAQLCQIGPPPPPSPTITSFTPTSGAVGAKVTIKGTNFSTATEVRFATTSATFTIKSATKITATVPPGAQSGAISVTGPGGTGTSTSSFTVSTPAPTIVSFTPTSGGAGMKVTIKGTNFAGATAVSFGATVATFSIKSATKLIAFVPAGATTGPISVSTPGGTTTSSVNFVVP